MSDSNEVRSVQITRVFDAPIELVYRAWTEAQHVQRWMKCDAEAVLELENWEPRVGAEFKTRMVKPGVFEVDGTGRFLEVDPPRLLVYRSDADPKLGTPELTVRVELVEVEGGTQLTLTHSGIPNDFLHGIIEGGWTTSLEFLREVVVALVGAYAGARMGRQAGSGASSAASDTEEQA